ncbi:MAG: PepSY domain-containing protein [Gemmatimonadaceae bacterium]|nr:PepSY domain-containing protein [Gemmatimonadaceae bacterium]
MQQPKFVAGFTALMLVCGTSAAMAQGSPLKVSEEKPGMLKQAKVTPEAALATAQAKVPGGTLKEAEIEKEDGKLVFVFSFTQKGKKGEDEVLVDAMTGALVKTEHESPAQEAKEKAAEGKVKPKGAKADSGARPRRGG